MTLGTHSYIGSTGSNITANVTIGNYTSIATHVQMHNLLQHSCIAARKIVSTHQMSGYPPIHIDDEPIKIGNDVWIGTGVILLGPITIADGAIIGAFSVVAKDIPPYAVVVGNPAIIKRYRFTPVQIEKLLQIQWWNWLPEKVEENRSDFLDIESFLLKNS